MVYNSCPSIWLRNPTTHLPRIPDYISLMTTSTPVKPQTVSELVHSMKARADFLLGMVPECHSSHKIFDYTEAAACCSNIAMAVESMVARIDENRSGREAIGYHPVTLKELQQIIPWLDLDD